MAAILADQHFSQFSRVREITVMAETDSVGRVDEERLCFGGRIAARGGITHMADANVALERQHVPMLEHIAHQSGLLAQEKLAVVTSHDACRILSAVLKHG